MEYGLHFLTFLIPILVGAVVYVFLVIRRFRQLYRGSIRPSIKLTSKAEVDLPPEIKDRVESARQQVQVLGFEEFQCFEIVPDYLSSRCCCFMFKNPARTEIAHIVVSMYVACKKEYVGLHLVFQTGFVDGLCMQTNNDQNFDVCVTRPSCRHVQLPSILDSRELYSIHKTRVDQCAHAFERLNPYEGKQPAEILEYEHSDYLSLVQHQLKIGRLYMEDDGLSYRTTWKGAALFVLGNLWPAKHLRLAGMRRNGRRLLAQTQDV